MVRASRDNSKIMLEVMLEAWGKKINKNIFFLIEKDKILIETLKIIHNLLNSLTTASVCRTGT